MAWTQPRIWSAGESPTAYIFNTQIRDNENVLKTCIDDTGRIVTGLFGVAYSGGGAISGVNANTGTGSTKLTGYSCTVPANALANPGDSIIIEGTLVLANNTNAKTLGLKFGGGSTLTILSNAAAVVNHIVPFRVVLNRHSSVQIVIWGMAYPGATGGGAPSTYLVNVNSSSIDFTIPNVLDVYAQGGATGDIFLTDYTVRFGTSWEGASV